MFLRFIALNPHNKRIKSDDLSQRYNKTIPTRKGLWEHIAPKDLSRHKMPTGFAHTLRPSCMENG